MRIRGALIDIAVSCEGSFVWGIGVGHHVYFRNGANDKWTQIPGKLQRISVAGLGKHVWAVNKHNDIFYRTGIEGKWRHIPGQLNEISVSGDGEHIWGLSVGNDVYYKNGVEGEWKRYSGIKLSKISVSSNAHHLWGVDSTNKIYYRHGHTGHKWVSVPGKLTEVSALNSGYVWGVDPANNIYTRREKEVKHDQEWLLAPGRLSFIQASGDGKHIWGINSFGKVFYRPGINALWFHMPGNRLKLITLSNNGYHIYGLGSGPKKQLWYRQGVFGKWQLQKEGSGKFKDIAISGNGYYLWALDVAGYIYYRTMSEKWKHIGDYKPVIRRPMKLRQILVSTDGNHVWGINLRNDKIVYRPGGVSGRWKTISSTLTFKYISISSNDGHIWGISPDNYIWYRTGYKGKWYNIAGKLKQISPADDTKHIWGVDQMNRVFYR